MARKSAMVNRPTVKGKQASSGVSKKASETYISISTLRKLIKRVANFTGDDPDSLIKVIEFIFICELSCIFSQIMLLTNPTVIHFSNRNLRKLSMTVPKISVVQWITSAVVYSQETSTKSRS